MRILSKLILVFALISLFYPVIFIPRYIHMHEIINTLAFVTNYGAEVSHANLQITYALNNIETMLENPNPSIDDQKNLDKQITLIQNTLSNWNNVTKSYLSSKKTPQFAISYLNQSLIAEKNIADKMKTSLSETKSYTIDRANKPSFTSLKNELFAINQIIAKMMMLGQKILKETFQNTRFRTIAFVMMTFIITFISLFIMGKVLISRLKRLKNAAEQIAKKDYGVRVTFTSKDETGILGETFNSMIESVARSHKNIESMINLLPSMFFLTSVNQDIKMTNKVASQRLNIPVEDLEHDNLRTLIQANYHTLLGKTLPAERIKLHGKDSNEIVALLSSTELTNIETNTKEFIYLIQDISLLETMKENAVKSARLAGMGEIATSILHMVGNSLNSLNTSTSLIRDKIQNTQVQKIVRLSTKIQENSATLQQYFTTEKNAELIYKFIRELSQAWEKDADYLNNEIINIKLIVNEIHQLITDQQSIYNQVAMFEETSIKTLLDEAIVMYEDLLAASHIKVAIKTHGSDKLLIDKFKLSQTINLLIKHCIHLFTTNNITTNQHRRMTIEVRQQKDNLILVTITCNQLVVPNESLTTMFDMAQTNKLTYFNTYLIALYVMEMKGAIETASDENMTKILITLPTKPSKARLEIMDHEDIN